MALRRNLKMSIILGDPVLLISTFNKHPVEGGEVEEEGKHPAGAVHLVKHGHRHICR